jgi:hypothetical protein
MSDTTARHTCCNRSKRAGHKDGCWKVQQEIASQAARPDAGTTPTLVEAVELIVCDTLHLAGSNPLAVARLTGELIPKILRDCAGVQRLTTEIADRAESEQALVRDVDRLCAERERLESEIADLRTRFSHHHVASSDDSCGRCGLDLRNPIHHRS